LIDHFDAIRRGELRDSGFNSCYPTLHDPSQAPAGKHTGLISCHAPYNLADGGAEKWYDIRDSIADQCLAQLKKYVPNVNDDTIMWRYITTPKDIHNKFIDMREGSFKQGAYLPLQMGYLRPNELCAEYCVPSMRPPFRIYTYAVPVPTRAVPYLWPTDTMQPIGLPRTLVSKNGGKSPNPLCVPKS